MDMHWDSGWMGLQMGVQWDRKWAGVHECMLVCMPAQSCKGIWVRTESAILNISLSTQVHNCVFKSMNVCVCVPACVLVSNRMLA